MTKFNKSLLTVAVAGAIALPGLAAAATLSYPAGKQIHFAKDLIVNNGTTIYTPDELRLAASGANDIANLATVAAGDSIRVKVTLTQGARFDTTASAATLVAGFVEGAQTGGAGAITVVGTPYYSTSGQELNFEYSATAAGVIGAPGAFFLELNSFQITNLVGGLFTGSSVGAEITVQNAVGQQILASKAEIARSVWGVVYNSIGGGDINKTIDVASEPRKTLFSPVGIVGGSDPTNPASLTFNAGGVEVDIASADVIGGGTSYVNNFSAVSSNPEYNIVTTADIKVTVTGTDLAAFNHASRAWLDQSAACTGTVSTPVNVGLSSATELVFTSSATSTIWQPVTNASPSAAQAYLCLGVGGGEMQAQDLTGQVEVVYNLSTQRVDPPSGTYDLLPLRLNGTTIIFQNVNPAGNSTAQSFLRITNNNAAVCPVTVDAKDDAGLHSGEVKITLAAHGSVHLNSEDLENGNASKGATGGFGDGTGKWYVRVTAECDHVKASALNRNADNGVVTDLTAEKGTGREWLTPATKL